MFKKEDTLKVKGIAILLLLFHHLFYSSQRIESNGIVFHILSQNTVQQIAVAARICVWIFLFLSAYGLTCQFYIKKQSISIFTFSSWFSLMKSFWFVYIVVFASSFLLFSNPIEIYGRNPIYLLLDFFGFADLFGTPMLSNVWWYMCLTQILILILPVLIYAGEKIGWLMFPLMFLGLQYLNPGIESNFGGDYLNYLLVISLGVLCSQKSFFEKNSAIPKSLMGKLLDIFIVSGITILCLYYRIRLESSDIWRVRSVLSCIAVLGICYIAYKYICFSILEKALAFLGVHSGNIFMFHALVYTYYPSVVYYSKNVFISYATLLTVSVLISMFIEKSKAICGYNQCSKLIEKKLLCFFKQ